MKVIKLIKSLFSPKKNEGELRKGSCYPCNQDCRQGRDCPAK